MIEIECLETFEQVEKELEAVEQTLAQRHEIAHPVRENLFELCRKNHLVEDELLSRWHELYASYMDYLRATLVELEKNILAEQSCWQFLASSNGLTIKIKNGQVFAGDFDTAKRDELLAKNLSELNGLIGFLEKAKNYVVQS